MVRQNETEVFDLKLEMLYGIVIVSRSVVRIEIRDHEGEEEVTRRRKKQGNGISPYWIEWAEAAGGPVSVVKDIASDGTADKLGETDGQDSDTVPIGQFRQL